MFETFVAVSEDHRASDIFEFLNILPVAEASGDLKNLALAHAINQNIRFRVHQDRSAYALFPIVKMGETPETRLDAAQYHRYAWKKPFDLAGVNDRGPVRTKTGSPSRRIIIRAPRFLARGVIAHHGIEITSRDPEKKVRTAQREKILGSFPIGLRNDPDLVPRILQDPSDDRRSIGRMVHVGIARDKNNVARIPPENRRGSSVFGGSPAALRKVLFGYRKEFFSVSFEHGPWLSFNII